MRVWIVRLRISNASAFFFLWVCALFTGLASTEKCKSNFKTRSHRTVHTFKNYFAIVFSVFNFQQ